MIRAYVDQNFLINCANSPDLHRRALDAVRETAVAFVLSPWHLYEIGKLSPQRSEELIDIAESLIPEWILDRSDLQVGEFHEAWSAFYGFPRRQFRPIGTLPQVASILLHSSPASLARFSLRDYVRVFQMRGTTNLSFVLDQQQAIAALNQTSVHNGLMTEEMKDKIQVAYATLMLARERETAAGEEALRNEEAAIRGNAFLQSLIRHFIKNRQMLGLRTWQVESFMTDRHHAGTAKLNHNRQVDRQHAAAALSYCDRFVTDDKELLRLCGEIRNQLPFTAGAAVTSTELLRA